MLQQTILESGGTVKSDHGLEGLVVKPSAIIEVFKHLCDLLFKGSALCN